MSKAPSVLVVLTETYSAMGGIQRFNRRLVQALTAAGQGKVRPVGVVALRDHAVDVPAELRGVVSVARDRGHMVKAVWREARWADLLFVGHINLLPLVLIAKLRRPRLQIFLQVHGIEVWNRGPYRRRRWFEPALLRLVDRITSVSDYTARAMSAAFKVAPEKFVCLPNAVDALGPPSSQLREPVVLCVSRLDAHDRGKNVDTLIRAFALVHQRCPDARLQIVGDGVLRPELERQAAEAGVAEAVQFVGRLNDFALQLAYGSARVFALPSSKEGFGIVFLEAWCHGLPVICGSEDAAAELVSDGIDGFVVAPSDIGLLAERMHQLLLDPEKAREMGASGALKVADRYSDEQFRQNLAAVLQGAVH
jgi:phosphatidylinositol alpha-1,6-mannosyltransferase